MRVLIVEDEAGIRGFLARAIEYLIPGVYVQTEANGLLGLEAFLKSPIDLVISDHRMPAMSGIELLQHIRRQSAVPFIMLSAETALERPAILAGASVYLRKPVSLSELRAALASTLTTYIDYTEPCTK